MENVKGEEMEISIEIWILIKSHQDPKPQIIPNDPERSHIIPNNPK